MFLILLFLKTTVYCIGSVWKALHIYSGGRPTAKNVVEGKQLFSERRYKSQRAQQQSLFCRSLLSRSNKELWFRSYVHLTPILVSILFSIINSIFRSACRWQAYLAGHLQLRRLVKAALLQTLFLQASLQKSILYCWENRYFSVTRHLKSEAQKEVFKYGILLYLISIIHDVSWRNILTATIHTKRFHRKLLLDPSWCHS
jgi:hypothetical protein